MNNNNFHRLKFLLLLCYFFLIPTSGKSQDIELIKIPHLYFPAPMQKNWQFSIGITTITTPEEITEEHRIPIPAGDLHLNRNITGNFFLNSRVKFQVFQNHISLGPRYAFPVSDKFYISIGDDIAWWFGKLKFEGFDTRAVGIINYPNISLGYKFDDKLLFTLKSEIILDLYYHSWAGDNLIVEQGDLFGGYAFTFAIEQPFYKKQHLTLGFRAIHADFFWQTWALYQTFERNLFYPELIIGFIL